MYHHKGVEERVPTLATLQDDRADIMNVANQCLDRYLDNGRLWQDHDGFLMVQSASNLRANTAEIEKFINDFNNEVSNV